MPLCVTAHVHLLDVDSYDRKSVFLVMLSLCLPQVSESVTLYKQCVHDARLQQDELVKAKERIISHIRKLICQGDNVLKEVGLKSGHLQDYMTAD